jgi:hypothetical protein
MAHAVLIAFRISTAGATRDLCHFSRFERIALAQMERS